MLSPAGAAPPAEQVPAVISHSLWTSEFDESPGIIGHSFQVDSVFVRVAGVAPAGFGGVDGPEANRVRIWLPLGSWQRALARSLAQKSTCSSCSTSDGVAGVGIEQVRAQAEVLGRRIHEPRVGEDPQAATVRVSPLRRVDPSRIPLLPITLASGTVLLLATVNASGLMYARLRERHSDWAVRIALGATRRHLLQETNVRGTVCRRGEQGVRRHSPGWKCDRPSAPDR